jgi:hypothetical protein
MAYKTAQGGPWSPCLRLYPRKNACPNGEERFYRLRPLLGVARDTGESKIAYQSCHGTGAEYGRC